MEIELLETGARVIEGALETQDVTDYITLLSADVLLVTHFVHPLTMAACVPAPPPTAASITAAVTASGSQPANSVPRSRDSPMGSTTVLPPAAKAPDGGVTVAQTRATKLLQDRFVAASSPSKKRIPTPSSPQAAASTTVAAARGDTAWDDIPFALQGLRATVAAARAGDASPDSRMGDSATESRFHGMKEKLHGSRNKSSRLESSEARSAHRKRLSESAAVAARCGGTVAFGVADVTYHMYVLLRWLNEAKHTAAVEKVLEPRKRLLQEGEKLPQLPPPQTDSERFRLLGRQYTENNQLLSRLVVRWGREKLKLEDECFFDDGKMVTIHRRLLPPLEGVSAQVLANERRILFHKTQSRLLLGPGGLPTSPRSACRKVPLLDFSFCKVQEVVQLLQVRPVGGSVHAIRTSRRNSNLRSSQGLYLNEANDPGNNPVQVKRTLITAKSKKGEEEAYEFSDEPRRGVMDFLDDRHDGASVVERLAGGLTNKYDAECLRAAGCGLVDISYIVPVVRRLVASAAATLQWLDLSQNKIQKLPPLAAIPLVRLYLHGNAISDWDEIEHAICPLPLLQFLTLHGNPLSDSDPNYRVELIARMARHPARQRPLRCVDFSTVTAQDYHVSAMFGTFYLGDHDAMPRALTFSAISSARSRPQRHQALPEGQ